MPLLDKTPVQELLFATVPFLLKWLGCALSPILRIFLKTSRLLGLTNLLPSCRLQGCLCSSVGV